MTTRVHRAVEALDAHLSKAGVAFSFGIARRLVEEDYNVDDLLKQSDEQLVSLLKEVGMKHKSILAFMSYVHGLKAGLEKPAGSSDIAAATSPSHRHTRATSLTNVDEEDEFPFDNFSEVNQCLSIILLSAKRSYDTAEDDYRAALRENSSFEWAHNALGLVFMNVRRDYNDAERSFRKAIELDPNYAWAHNNLGLLLLEVRQDLPAAEASLRKALDIDPKHGEAHCNLATLLNQRAETLEEQGTDVAAAAALFMEAAEHWQVRHGSRNNYSRQSRAKAAHLLGVTK